MVGIKHICELTVEDTKWLTKPVGRLIVVLFVYVLNTGYEEVITHDVEYLPIFHFTMIIYNTTLETQKCKQHQKSGSLRNIKYYNNCSSTLKRFTEAVAKYRLQPYCTIPFGPRTRTVSFPGPAPLVSTTKLLWKVANIPDSMPGPLIRTLLASIPDVTLNVNGLPARQFT